MVVDQGFIVAPSTVTTEFKTDVVTVTLHSFHLIEVVEEYSGFGAWVYDVAQKLTPQERYHHSLVNTLSELPFATKGIWATFEAFLDDVAAIDATQLRDESMFWMKEKASFNTPDDVLGSVDDFIQFMKQCFSAKIERGMTFDEKRWRDMYAYFKNPTLMKSTLLDHLQTMWTRYAKDEWMRHKNELEETVSAYRDIDFSGLTFFEVLEAVTGRDLRGNDYYHETANKIARIIFIPSPHIGPYVALMPTTDARTFLLVFGARLPKGLKATSPNLNRSELLIRMSALADDTRLQMLELLVQHGELCAQDFINMLGLSQSSASRHLRQLTASGYIIERRKEVAKCYNLNRDRIEDTLQALKTFLKA